MCTLKFCCWSIVNIFSFNEVVSELTEPQWMSITLSNSCKKVWWWPSDLLWLLYNLAPMKHQKVSNILNVKSSKALTLCFTHQNHHYIRENLISLRTTKQCNVRQKQQLVRWQRRERLNCSEANPSPSARARDQTTADSQSCQLATTSADSKTSADSETIDCWF